MKGFRRRRSRDLRPREGKSKKRRGKKAHHPSHCPHAGGAISRGATVTPGHRPAEPAVAPAVAPACFFYDDDEKERKKSFSGWSSFSSFSLYKLESVKHLYLRSRMEASGRSIPGGPSPASGRRGTSPCSLVFFLVLRRTGRRRKRKGLRIELSRRTSPQGRKTFSVALLRANPLSLARFRFSS